MRDYAFALCLTHDVDRVYKTFQGPYYALEQRDLSHLNHYVSSERPYWQFESIMKLEDDLGVRSSFYFLNEKHILSDKRPREWLRAKNWMLYSGRYDVTDDEIVEVIRTLDRNGWEVGLHGSYDSYRDPGRLRHEKSVLEGVLGHEIVGGRQHYLNLERPETWRHHRSIGLKYDSSLGSSTEFGFDHGYTPLFPFDDEFTVFPVTIMDIALMNSMRSIEQAKETCRSILQEAKENEAVMTILWHPRVFNEDEFEGYREAYVYLIETAQEMGAWIGPCGTFHEQLLGDERWMSA